MFLVVSIKKNITFSAIGLIGLGRQLEQKSAQKACAAGGEDFNQYFLKIRSFWYIFCYCWRVRLWFQSFKICSGEMLASFWKMNMVGAVWEFKTHKLSKRFLDSWSEFDKFGISEFDSVAESWCPGFGDDRQLVTQNWEIEMVSRDNHGAAVVVSAATAPMADAVSPYIN